MKLFTVVVFEAIYGAVLIGSGAAAAFGFLMHNRMAWPDLILSLVLIGIACFRRYWSERLISVLKETIRIYRVMLDQRSPEPTAHKQL